MRLGLNFSLRFEAAGQQTVQTAALQRLRSSIAGRRTSVDDQLRLFGDCFLTKILLTDSVNHDATLLVDILNGGL